MLPKWPAFQPDPDDATSIDDLYWPNVNLRIERMDNGFYWMGIEQRDKPGTWTHIDVTIERPTRERPLRKIRIRARPRT